MRGQQGITLAETLLSMAVTSVLLTSVFTSFVAGQSAFLTSEATLEAQQTARNALDVIQQDLAGAQIYGYFNGQDPSVQPGGNGKVFVKFRRLDPSLVDDSGNPNWQATPIFMYLWCPAGNGPGHLGQNVCAQVLPAPPTARQLVLVRSGTPGDPAANPLGLNTGSWTLVRVVSSLMQNPTADAADQSGFVVTAWDANGGAVLMDPTRAPDIDPRRVDVAIRTARRGTGSMAARVVRTGIQSRLELRNAQP